MKNGDKFKVVDAHIIKKEMLTMAENETYKYKTLESNFSEFIGLRAVYRSPECESSEYEKASGELESLLKQIEEALPEKWKGLVREVEIKCTFIEGDLNDWYYKKGFLDGIGLCQSIHG